MRNLYTTAEAVKTVSALRRKYSKVYYYIHIRGDAPIVDKPDNYFPGGLGTYIPLTRKAAIQIVKELLNSTLESRGARIPLSINENGTTTSCWIG